MTIDTHTGPQTAPAPHTPAGYPDVPDGGNRRRLHTMDEVAEGDLVEWPLATHPKTGEVTNMKAVVVSITHADPAAYANMPGEWVVMVLADSDGKRLASGMPFLFPAGSTCKLLSMVRPVSHQCNACRAFYDVLMNVAESTRNPLNGLNKSPWSRGQLTGTCARCTRLHMAPARPAELTHTPPDTAPDASTQDSSTQDSRQDSETHTPAHADKETSDDEHTHHAP